MLFTKILKSQSDLLNQVRKEVFYWVFWLNNGLHIDLSLRVVEDVINNKDKYKNMVSFIVRFEYFENIIVKLEKNNEALLAYVDELKRMKKFLLETGSSGDIEEE